MKLVNFNKNTNSNDSFVNALVLGTTGHGRGYHPWDNLKNCECGGYPWMQGKDGGNFEEGAPYRIECHKCKKHTKYSDVSEIKNDWEHNLIE